MKFDGSNKPTELWLKRKPEPKPRDINIIVRDEKAKEMTEHIGDRLLNREEESA